MNVGEQIDVSMKDICLYDLDEYYGKSILNKKVILFANDDATIVENFTREGKLKDLLNDEYLGDFFCDRQVLLIEKGKDVLLIDYEWDEDARRRYAKSLVSYNGNDTRYSIITKNGELYDAGCGYSAYKGIIEYVKDLTLDELVELEQDDGRIKISSCNFIIDLR